MTPNHVAILVRSAESAASYLRSRGFSTGPAEEFEGEGTREIYVEQEKGNSLLLLEAVKPGPYMRALEKRGPGLHHLAIDVPDLGAYLDSISSSGWLLHLRTLSSMKKTKTAYLARPGFPALIEVQERSGSVLPGFVDQIGLRFPQEHSRLLAAIGMEGLVQRTESEPWIFCAGVKIPISSL